MTLGYEQFFFRHHSLVLQLQNFIATIISANSKAETESFTGWIDHRDGARRAVDVSQILAERGSGCALAHTAARSRVRRLNHSMVLHLLNDGGDLSKHHPPPHRQATSVRESRQSKRESGESKRESGESKRESGESKRESGESGHESGESKRQSGESVQESVSSKHESGESVQESGES